MYYVYSLKCRKGYYIGCTSSLKERIERHNNGKVDATKNILPVKLDFYVAVNEKHVAFSFEKYLKTGSGRAFIGRHFASN